MSFEDQEITDFFDAADHELEFEQLRNRLGVVLDAISDGVITVGLDGCIELVNPAACTLLQMTSERLEGRHAVHVFNWVGKDKAAMLNAPMKLSFEEQLRRPDGSYVHCELKISPISQAGVTTGHVLIMRDITERIESYQRMQWMATHDQLTGLLNRAGLEEQIELWVKNHARSADNAILLFCDLDGFKAVNDVHGHEAGDIVLRVVGERIADSVRDHDVPARFAGDEFVVLLNNVDGNAQSAINRIEEAVEAPINIGETDVTVGISVGSSPVNTGKSARDLLRDADHAMYARKQERKSR
jgi:diguanylate cyclase (GGDEF)-like protein/PAS domain S-box-containing protein